MSQFSDSALPDEGVLAAQPDDAAVDVGSVAKLLSCSPRHVWRLVDRGAMPAPLRIGRLCRWRLGTLREWIREGAKPVRQEGRR
jgi:excisionase family DNA binding protein